MDRRSFLSSAAVGATVVATACKAHGKSQERRLGMVIDLSRCIGCQACRVSCKMEHAVRPGGFRSWVNNEEVGKYPHVKRYFLPRLCNHCDDATCVRVCPTSASYKREDGIVLVDKDRCVGCRACINACPYGSRYFNWYNEQTADVSRTPGTPDKCTFCVHRVDKGVVPACVNTCPAKARIFGDLNDPNSEVAKLVATLPVQVLRPEYETMPKVYYVGLREGSNIHPPQGGR